MLYPKCPSCKTLFANKELIYEKELDSICKNSKLTESQKDKAKMELLNSLELFRPCCRPRILGYIDLIKIIK
jgi:DNA-directed RNA polymerase subunit N (RpoN/RPB10)